MSEKSDWEQGYDQARRRFYEERKFLTARIAKLEAVIEILEDQQREAKNILIDKNLHIDSLYEEGYKLQQRIAMLEATVEVGADIANAYENRISEIVALSNETVGKLNSRIAKLEAERRWIPVSERLPETYKPVLTVDMSEATQIPVPAFYNPDTKCWSTHFKYDLWVTHWMPLPEPPEVK